MISHASSTHPQLTHIDKQQQEEGDAAADNEAADNEAADNEAAGEEVEHCGDQSKSDTRVKAPCGILNYLQQFIHTIIQNICNDSR